jgi:hypothetical protein
MEKNKVVPIYGKIKFHGSKPPTSELLEKKW